MSVEVFKTDVKDQVQANRLIEQIHETFVIYKANFDLDDCDKILRICSATGFIQTSVLIGFLEDRGCNAQVLPDEIYPAGKFISIQPKESIY